MRVRYIAPFGIRTGYAQAAHDYISALALAGCELDVIPLNPGDADSLDARYHHLIPFVNRDLEEVDIHLVHTIPAAAPTFAEGDYKPEAGTKRVCITTWETDKLPAEFAEGLHRSFDRIIVPSWFNREVFRDAGIPAQQMEVVPHTYDPGFWHPPDDGRWTKDWKRPEVMNFYTVGVWGARKNLLGTILAYWHAFSAPGWADKVKLTVLAPPAPEGLLEDFVARCALKHYAPVEFIDKSLNENELRELHVNNDVFISATRGEAWGLGAFEAAIMGNRLILPHQGGQRDFVHRSGNFIEVPHQMTPVAPENHSISAINVAGMRLRSVARVAPTGLAADQCWAEPDIAKMAVLLRQTCQIVITRARPPDMEPFTYATVGPMFRRILEEV